MKSSIHTKIKAFKNQNILVIGDVMIDAYYFGKVSRISPEAPVPIVDLSSKENRLGGAANVALNVQALGGNPILCSVVGDDTAASDFMQLMKEHNLFKHGIFQSEERRTTVKSRIIGNQQQLVRLDEEEIKDLHESLENQFLNHTLNILEENDIDAIIFEDYDKGVLTPKIIKKIVSWANENKIITTVDPKKRHFFNYEGVTLFKPNLKELKEGLKTDVHPSDKASFIKAVEVLESRLKNEITLVTLSEYGIFVKENETSTFTPAHKRNISDVSGAGDTVIAVATMALVADATPSEMAIISNLSGGLVCEVSGVIPINFEQLSSEIDKLKL